MVRNMLDGAARDRWDTIIEHETKRTTTNSLGVEVEAKGETETTFLVSCELFKRSWFKSTSRTLMIKRDYLQHNIRFPTKAELTLEEFYNRILNINSKLRDFHTPLGYLGNKYFSDEELKFLILRALPHYCTLQVHKSGRTLDQFTLDSLREFLDVCLMEKRNPKKGEKTRPPKRGQNKEKEKFRFWGQEPKKEGAVFLLALQSKKPSPQSVLVTQ